MDAAASMDERSDGVGVVSRAGTALPLLTSVKTRIHAKLHSVDADLTISPVSAKRMRNIKIAWCLRAARVERASSSILDAFWTRHQCNALVFNGLSGLS